MFIQATVTSISEFPDVLAIQSVSYDNFCTFNYVAGIVPYIRTLIEEREKGCIWKTRDENEICKVFKQFNEFLYMNKVVLKKRQKLLRNLHILELSVKLLSYPIENQPDRRHLVTIFRSLCNILVSYTEGKSKKNARHTSKYLDFFRKNMEGAVSFKM